MTDVNRTMETASDGRPSPSRWLRLCAGALISAVAAAIVLENLDGYHNELRFSVDDYAHEPPFINWSHGWPFVAFIRPSPEPANRTPTPAPGTGFTPPFLINGRWPTDAAPWIHFRPWALAADLAICGLILLGTAFMLVRWANCVMCRPSYGLRTLLFYITASAIAVYLLNRDDIGALEALRYASELELSATTSRYFVHAGALVTITFGAVLTLFAVFEVARIVFGTLVGRRDRSMRIG